MASQRKAAAAAAVVQRPRTTGGAATLQIRRREIGESGTLCKSAARTEPHPRPSDGKRVRNKPVREDTPGCLKDVVRKPSLKRRLRTIRFACQ